jgi:hypothetical protein
MRVSGDDEAGSIAGGRDRSGGPAGAVQLSRILNTQARSAQTTALKSVCWAAARIVHWWGIRAGYLQHKIMVTILTPREIDYDVLYHWCRVHGIHAVDLFRSQTRPTLCTREGQLWWRVFLPSGGEAIIPRLGRRLR